MRRAEAILAVRSDEPLTIAALAAEVGVGPRALQSALRRLRRSTPRGVLTTLRLERARARLQAPEPGTTVTDAAVASSFAHFGRFAAACRARSGEPPPDTLRRARP